MNVDDLTIVVCCNKRDFFLAKICIASVRYYYPDIPIELVKDLGNGYFNSGKLERAFNVKRVDLGIKKMGWSGAKFHYLYHMPKGKKVFLLDADIVFAGPFLERLQYLYTLNDYVVSADLNDDPYSDFARLTYFETRKIETKFPAYKHPGYFFNAGQLFVTVGSIAKEVLDIFFDQNKFPYWRDTDLFPLVDQSVYNYLLPTLANQGKLKLATDHFMVWCRSDRAKLITLESIRAKSFDGGVIHWAGDLRLAYVQKMTRGDILNFFEDYYFQQVSIGTAERFFYKLGPFFYYHMRRWYHQVKKFYKRFHHPLTRLKSGL